MAEFSDVSIVFQLCNISFPNIYIRNHRLWKDVIIRIYDPREQRGRNDMERHFAA